MKCQNMTVQGVADFHRNQISNKFDIKHAVQANLINHMLSIPFVEFLNSEAEEDWGEE